MFFEKCPSFLEKCPMFFKKAPLFLERCHFLMKENAFHDERKWFFTMKGQSRMERSKGNGEQDGGAKKVSNLSEEQFEIRDSPKRDLHEGASMRRTICCNVSPIFASLMSKKLAKTNLANG